MALVARHAPAVSMSRFAKPTSASQVLRSFSSSASKCSTAAPTPTFSKPRRSLLYVPGSSEKMLRKADSAGADTIVLDLEDSVADHQKGRAREAVYHKLNALAHPVEGNSSGRSEMAVRINPPSGSGPLAGDDLELLLPLEQLECILLPKVESEEDVLFVISRAQQLRPKEAPPLSLILSVESPASLFRMPTILDTVKKTAGVSTAGVTSLLFASEDFCHTAGITRTRSRRELLFPRQQLALIAKAYGGLGAIDMVCIDYKDEEYLREECRDGNEIGYDGKQAVSDRAAAGTAEPPTLSLHEAILRAVKIKAAYEEAVKGHRGAVGVTVGEQTLMIDAPQADATLAKALAAKKPIPDPRSS
ncbi:Phosphoenolpyruvate/pyruvate domain-containing protein [Microstroma glucosiphilum]|uniref:Phosphoenolpyruvate/pyruvate domain-containing protein n=1 Tax=Pseudomicrostroma glucosiphilum TaxID=1684307 RepID=A0A316UAV2_9BASI|nr:Phosphoenolpyruvate/pyruvate domain-containing protein [Pseudomicrostroma glucosiphilum]PWN21978.1 Phosphoenolpyruvate/pyruvate domain-containing protein [Pseudomicrostroma glucosiphilum]